MRQLDERKEGTHINHKFYYCLLDLQNESNGIAKQYFDALNKKKSKASKGSGSKVGSPKIDEKKAIV